MLNKKNSGEKDPELIDLSQESAIDDYKSPTTVAWHPEKERMKLAYCVLIVIFFIFIVSIGCNFLAYHNLADPELGRGLFEFSKTSLLPIVTFILGFYFSKNN